MSPAFTGVARTNAAKKYDQNPVPALKAISEAIEWCNNMGLVVSRILTHPTWTTRGYVFVVYMDEKTFIVLNENDLNHACAALLMKGADEDIVDYTYGVPISRDEKTLQMAICGVYKNTIALEQENYDGEYYY